ncbi:MAG: hypothetical protein ABEI97_04815, partial [Candidatus Nanohaloarchaea archaeon]
MGLALLTGAGASILSKFVAVSVNKLGFIGAAYALNTVLAMGVRGRLQETDGEDRHALVLGVL